MCRRRQVDDRGNAEIAQDLCTDPNLAPLPVAISFRRLRLTYGLDRNTGGAIAHIYQHAAAGFLEMLQDDLHAFRTGEKVLDDIRLVQPCQNIPAVADAIIDKGGMCNGVER